MLSAIFMQYTYVFIFKQHKIDHRKSEESMSIYKLIGEKTPIISRNLMIKPFSQHSHFLFLKTYIIVLGRRCLSITEI